MLLTVLAVSLLASAPCTLSGKVELKRSGKGINPAGRVVVFVEKVALTSVRVPVTRSILQTNRVFKPELLVLQTGDSVEFTNEDNEEHSVFSNTSTPPRFEFPKSKRGVTGRQTFPFAGPVRIQCDIHEWMRADLLVLQNPFFAVVEADGSWTIAGLPEGKHTVVAWELNGGEARRTVQACTAQTRVELPALDEAPFPKPHRKDARVYAEYQD